MDSSYEQETVTSIIETIVELLREEPQSFESICRRYFTAKSSGLDLRSVQGASHFGDRHSITPVVIHLAKVEELQEERRIARLVRTALKTAVEKSLIIKSDCEGSGWYFLPS